VRWLVLERYMVVVVVVTKGRRAELSHTKINYFSKGGRTAHGVGDQREEREGFPLAQ